MLTNGNSIGLETRNGPKRVYACIVFAAGLSMLIVEVFSILILVFIMREKTARSFGIALSLIACGHVCVREGSTPRLPFRFPEHPK